MRRLNELKGINTLLIDGDQMVRESLNLAFELSGVFLVTCRTGEEGLKIMEKTIFDIILFDQTLPGMSGLEFLKKSKSIYMDAIYVMTPSWWNNALISEAKKMGIDKIIEKPFSINALTDCLISMVKNQIDFKVKFNDRAARICSMAI